MEKSEIEFEKNVKLHLRDIHEETKTEEKSPKPSVSKEGHSSEGEVEENKPKTTITSEPDAYDNTVEGDLETSSAPPLPSEPLPGTTQEIDDGWAPIWEENAKGFYFFNRFTGASQWKNPRVPEASTSISPVGPPGVDLPPGVSNTEPPPSALKPGYNPAIHGDYDPNAWYAQPAQTDPILELTSNNSDTSVSYTATAAFNRFTGRFQNPDITPENFNDENKSKRQMNAYFDVDAAANSHDGRSLKAERSGKKLSKTELKQFREKRKMKKEERRRAWLRD